jgi:hypothetical protein
VQDAARACRSSRDGDIDIAEITTNPFRCEQPGSCAVICIDDVGVKKQKPVRRQRPAKTRERKRVWTTVAHARYHETDYTLTAEGVPAVLRLLAALLAASGLERIPLLFLTDGQRSLKDSIFSFWEKRGGIRPVLDWYHLHHRCKELGSYGLKGTIPEKRVHIRELTRLLWYGLTDRAIAYIGSLPPSAVARSEAIESMKGYIERNRDHIPCYAVRKQLGLPCSSNPVEKSNDDVVARRQKHNGMSWAEDGSHALATLSGVHRNGETENWLRTGTLSFSLNSGETAA